MNVLFHLETGKRQEQVFPSTDAIHDYLMDEGWGHVESTSYQSQDDVVFTLDSGVSIHAYMEVQS